MARKAFGIAFSIAIAACGSSMDGGASSGAPAPGATDHPPAGSGSFPLPSYWGHASAFAVRATIDLSGAVQDRLVGGAFGYVPVGETSETLVVAFGDPIFGIADGAWAYDFTAMIRRADGSGFTTGTYRGGDVGGSHLALNTAARGWGTDPSAAADFSLTVSGVEPAGQDLTPGRFAGSYSVIHGTLEVTLAQGRGPGASDESVRAEF